MHGLCLLNASHHPYPCGNLDISMHFQTPSRAPCIENQTRVVIRVGLGVRLRKALKSKGTNLVLILKTVGNR